MIATLHFFSANLNAPSVQAHQGVQHRLGRSLCGLVFRLLQRACLRLQARKRVVASICSAYSCHLRCSCLRVEDHSTTGASKQCCTAGTQNQQRSVVR